MYGLSLCKYTSWLYFENHDMLHFLMTFIDPLFQYQLNFENQQLVNLLMPFVGAYV